jgi:serine/threonine protein phosphatase PrpC
VRLGRFYAITDPGRKRMRNEDVYVCEPPLFAVADGMGGAQAGEVASRLAADALEEAALGHRTADTLLTAVQDANERVYRRALEDPGAAGMGTTVTVALVDEDEATVALAHVGDSRAYLVRNDELQQLTADHSLVAELVRSGRLTQEEADIHPQRSVITRVLGTEVDVDVDTLTVRAEADDLYLICSDGLSAMLRDPEILRIVKECAAEPRRVAEALVDAANRAGGEDNITVVAFEIVDRDPEPDAATAESALPADEPQTAVDPPEPVNRHGAGHGSRALALAAILIAVTAAALLIWWGVVR